MKDSWSVLREKMLDHRTDFERYSGAQDHSVNWDDPFGLDFTVEFHLIHAGLLVDSKMMKHQIIIENPYKW